MSDLLNPDWWIKRACRTFAAVLGILLFASLVIHAPFGPFLGLGAFLYITYRIWTARPERTTRRQQRNTGGAERTPVLPGGHQ